MDLLRLFSLIEEMNRVFLEGTVCSHQVFVAASHIPGARFGLFAREEIPAGTEILRAKPVVSAVASSEDACDKCFDNANLIDHSKPPVSLRNCASCKMVKYCSKSCQRAAWKSYHKHECAIYRDFENLTLKTNEDSIATRIFLGLILLYEHGKFTHNQWKAISALKSNMELIRPSTSWDLSAVKTNIAFLKKAVQSKMLESDLEEYYWRINANQHTVNTQLQPRLGNCLVPSAALINHSCSPNSHHLSEGPELVVRSYRSIAKNEEITLSYVNSAQSLEERQKMLANGYGFGCQCLRCQKEYKEQETMALKDSVPNASVLFAKSELYTLYIMLITGQHELNGVETKMRQICNQSGKPWPLNASPLPDLYVFLTERYEEEQQWQKALCTRLKLVYIINPLRYPQRIHPCRVEHLMTLSCLECMINDEDQASFREIMTAIAWVEIYHNIQLKQDAAASFGTNHVIYKKAVSDLEGSDKMACAASGISLGEWQSEECLRARMEIYKAKELELLTWAGIDPANQTM